METAIQLLFITLQIGAVYVLFSLGLTLVFGVMRIVNFAHGSYFALSALLVSVVLLWLAERGVPLPAAFLTASIVSIAASVGLGALTYQWGFRFFQRDLIGSFILSIGLVLVLDGVYLELFGGATRAVPSIIEGKITVFGAAITIQRLVLCITSVVVTALLYWVLTATKTGKALRAASIDHEAAMLQGIPYNRIAYSGFMIAVGLGALAGALIAPVTVVTPTIGESFIIKGFIAVIIGGLGSIPGAIIGSLIIAAVETLGGYYFDPSLATVATFVLVMIVLVVRPAGLVGRG